MPQSFNEQYIPRNFMVDGYFAFGNYQALYLLPRCTDTEGVDWKTW